MIAVKKLVWDEVNVTHIAEHDIAKDEVEEACEGDYLTLETYRLRIMLVGKTCAGKQITVILALKSAGIYYPVTARTSSRKERRYYQEHKGGEQAA